MTSSRAARAIGLFSVLALLPTSGCVAATDATDGELLPLSESCPGRAGVHASRLDAERGCLEWPMRLCADTELREELACAHDGTNDDLYLTANPLVVDSPLRWLRCSDAESSLVVSAPRCE